MERKTIAAISSAVFLAIILIIGGSTLAIGSGEENTQEDFTLNSVTLTETSGDVSGDEEGIITVTGYELIPGTSQSCDPTVTVYYTADAYIFIEVEDTSGGLITWEPAEGWKLLGDEDTDDDNTEVTAENESSETDTTAGTTRVYYREVTTSDAEKCTDDNETEYYMASISVLDSDQISYSSAIGNENTIEKEPLADGTGVVLKSGNMSLTFKAYLAQAINSMDEENTWLVASGEAVAFNETTGVAYTTTLQAAVLAASAGDTVTLTQDVSEDITISSSVTLDLSGNTLTGTSEDAKGTITLENRNAMVTIKSSKSGGTITGNSNGIHILGSGALTVEGVTISGNSGSGIGTTQGNGTSITITLNNTTISGNGGSGLSATKYTTATINSGTVINNNSGVGISNGGTLNMTDGTITSNGAEGVYNTGEFTMSGGTITQNTGANGTAGGVRNTGTFTMSGGSITENVGGAGAGGIRNTGTFTMNGGTISGNSGIYGGVFSRGTVTMTGGMITENAATSGGGGVYVYDGTFSVSGSPTVTDNTLNGVTNNVQLNTGEYITFANELVSGASIGVTTNTKPTSDSPVQITAAGSSTTYYSGALESGYIKSDSDSYTVGNDAENGYLILQVN